MLRATLSYAIASALALVVLGHLLRDRTPWLGLIMLVPVLPVALGALGWDVLMRGRSLPVRWLLSVVAVGCSALALSWQWQPALAPEPGAAADPVRIVQWNTQWGGADWETFDRVLDGLDAERPDIACLSEAPNTHRLERAWTKRHPDWFVAAAANSRDAPYAYNLAVLSRYPVQLRDEWTLRNGHAALFEIELRARALRVLIVDLESSPFAPRSPSIRQAAQLAAAQAKQGAPIDVVLGDFNTPARFLGFDALAAAGGGYRLASRWTGRWRGTWPASMRLPLFDIDHIWIGKPWSIESARFFTGYSDHRGQRVDIRLRSR